MILVHVEQVFCDKLIGIEAFHAIVLQHNGYGRTSQAFADQTSAKLEDREEQKYTESQRDC